MTATTAPRIDRYFRVSERGSTLTREVRGGATTFMAMAYILLLSPVLYGGKDAAGGVLSRPALVTSTAGAAAVATLIMGVVGRLPVAMAAGLGVSSVIATQVAPVMTWPQTMGVCVLYGGVIILLVLTGLRRRIMQAIPLPLKHAITLGIALFIALTGLVRAGFVQQGTAMAPLTLGTAGHLTGWPVAFFILTLLLIIILHTRSINGAILLGLVAGTAAAALVSHMCQLDATAWGGPPPALHGPALAWPDPSLIGHVSIPWDVGALTLISALATLVLTAFTAGAATLISVSTDAGLTDESGHVPGMARAQLADGAGGAIGGLAAAGGQGAFVESAAGVAEGARTGLASVVTALGFTLCLFFTPLTQLIPTQVAAAALVVIGSMMMRTARHIAWNDPATTIPVFLTMALMPFTYSITAGIAAGSISYAVIKAAQGKRREVPPLTWGLAAVFLLYFASHPIATYLTGGHP